MVFISNIIDYDGMKIVIFFNKIILFKTASIESSIYDSEWVNSSQKLKKMILMIMHASKGYTFTAYGVFDLNREQLSAVMFNATVYYCEVSFFF